MQKQKIIPLCIDIVILFLYALILYYILSNNVIFDLDDINSTIKSYPIWREENGRYICNFISRIFGYYIPILTNSHLQNSINSFGAFIYIIIIIALLKITSLFSYISGKNKIISSLCIIPVLIIFSRYFFNSLPNYIYIYSFQYGYVLANVFGFGFLYFLLNFLINNELPKDKKKNVIFISILGYCAGNSSQIITASIMVVLFLSVIIFRKDYKENLGKKVLKYPIISYIIGFLSMVLCPGFWIEVSWRHAKTASEIINNIIPFCKKLPEYIWFNPIFYIEIIIALIILIFIFYTLNKKIKEGIKLIIISLLPPAGVISYYFTLILGGKTFPSEPLGFWIEEPFYQYYYLMVLALTISLLIGFLTSQIKNKYIKYALLLTFLVIFIEKNLYCLNKNIIIRQKQELQQIRANIYECDKIILKQYYTGQKEIIAPKYCIQSPITIYSHPQHPYYQVFYNIDKIDISYSEENNLIKENLEKINFKEIKKEINESYNTTTNIQ